MTAGNEPPDVWTNVHFWLQIVGDMRRTVVCAPDLEKRVKQVIDEAGLSGLFTVRAHAMAPLNQVLVIDEQAMKAQMYPRFD